MTASSLTAGTGFALLLTLGSSAVAADPAPAGIGELDRTVLPIQESKRPKYKELDVRNVKMPPHFGVKAPGEAAVQEGQKQVARRTQ
jgi:hypothetical protein